MLDPLIRHLSDKDRRTTSWRHWMCRVWVAYAACQQRHDSETPGQRFDFVLLHLWFSLSSNIPSGMLRRNVVVGMSLVFIALPCAIIEFQSTIFIPC